MLNKFIKDVVIIVVGKQAEDIADLLNSKNYVNEFIIAKKLGITINQTRNLLYKISDYGLVSSIRKKDKKKGWFTYFWKIEALKSLEFLRDILLNKIQQLKNQIRNRESKQFYICERCNIEFNEENALLNNFTCNECGTVFVLRDNSKVLRELRRNLEKLNKELDLVEEEINKQKEKMEKERLKEAKKKEKKKLKKKPKKKAVKKKSKKEAGKKKVVKKTTKKKQKLKSKNVVKKKIKKPKKTSKKKTIKKPKKPKKKVTKKKKK